MPSRLLALALAVAVLLMGHGVRFGEGSTEAAWRQAAQTEVAAVAERGSAVAGAAKPDSGGEPPWLVFAELAASTGRDRPRLALWNVQPAVLGPHVSDRGWAERERGPPVEGAASRA